MLSIDNTMNHGRQEGSARREQILEAALALLSDTPLEELTTRQIAERVGVSQPALFRHFKSRDEIVFEALVQVRESLAGAAAAVLDPAAPPLEQLRSFARALLGHVAANPGVPRLVFGAPRDPALLAALRDLAGAQRTLVTTLLEAARGAGALDPSVDPAVGARAFVAMVQGTVLQWMLAGRAPDLVAWAMAPLDQLLAGLAPGPHGRAEAAPMPAPAREVEPFRDLDVRPILASGSDPLETILAALTELPRGGLLRVTAPFRPAPLVRLLSGLGHGVIEWPPHRGAFVVEVVKGDVPVLDLRDLEAPEPMVRVLEAAGALRPGEVLLARVPRVPRPLLAEIARRGLRAWAAEAPDESGIVRVIAAEGTPR